MLRRILGQISLKVQPVGQGRCCCCVPSCVGPPLPSRICRLLRSQGTAIRKSFVRRKTHKKKTQSSRSAEETRSGSRRFLISHTGLPVGPRVFSIFSWPTAEFCVESRSRNWRKPSFPLESAPSPSSPTSALTLLSRFRRLKRQRQHSTL